jgi:hypothetical protein
LIISTDEKRTDLVQQYSLLFARQAYSSEAERRSSNLKSQLVSTTFLVDGAEKFSHKGETAQLEDGGWFSI